MNYRLNKFFVAFLICLLLSSWSSYLFADEPQNFSKDVAVDALPGFINLGIPYAQTSRLSLAATGRYGFIESMGPVSGSHHELGGDLAVGGSFAKWFSAALMFDGKYQKHPADTVEGADSSIIGLPVIKFRVGAPVGEKLLLGGELDIRIPGAEFPSVKFNATTLAGRLLATLVSTAPFYLGFSAGFRLDNSENSAPAQASLRAGDRIALDVSEYHAFLLGIAMAYDINRIRLILEADSQIYAASKPPVSESPTRISFGARFGATEALQFDLYTETIVSKRPDVEQDAPLLPIQPRFAVMLGMRYSFGSSSAPNPDDSPSDREDSVSDTPADSQAKIPDAPEIISGTVQGRILDEEGLPVAAASIVLVASDGSEHMATTDPDGNYVLEKVPTGGATVSASAEYFEPQTFDVTVSENTVNTASPARLIQSKVGSQIRGLVRDVAGQPLKARIVVTPGRLKVNTDDEGFFELDVEPGEYTVEITSGGYVKQKRTVTVGDNSVVILNVDLSAK